MPLLRPKKQKLPLENVRREPLQERSKVTVDTIFLATAQIVDTEGEQALSTNKIAAKAGFSIGTLYQYFPSKEAIVQSMCARERQKVMGLLDALLTQAEQTRQEPLQVLRQYIKVLVLHMGTGRGDRSDALIGGLPRKLRGTMVRLAWQLDDYEVSAQEIRQFSERIALYLSRISGTHPELGISFTPASLFVISRSVLGAIRSASLEKSALLGTAEFEEQLVLMVYALLRPKATQALLA